MNRRPIRLHPLGVAALTLTLAAALGGCGSTSVSSSTSAPSASPSFAAGEAHHVSLTGGWVSSVAGSGSDMSDMPGMDMSSSPASSGMGMDSESAAYATVTNHGATADAIVGVSTPAAASATLHKTVTKDAAGTMVAVKAIPVPAGGQVRLQPGGYHVMLMGLRRDFSAGSTIEMTWRFRSGTVLTTRFPVIDVTDRPTTDGGQ